MTRDKYKIVTSGCWRGAAKFRQDEDCDYCCEKDPVERSPDAPSCFRDYQLPHRHALYEGYRLGATFAICPALTFRVSACEPCFGLSWFPAFAGTSGVKGELTRSGGGLPSQPDKSRINGQATRSDRASLRKILLRPTPFARPLRSPSCSGSRVRTCRQMKTRKCGCNAGLFWRPPWC